MKITYLNMIDVPKIHTITRFGERIVLTNAAFTDVITDTYIAVCEKLISLLEPRIRSFTGMAEQFERGESSAVFPPWFSETVSGYWAAAGLPQTIAGTFFGPGQEAVRIPGVLSFRPAESGRGLLGWHFGVGENEPASLYIDPLKSAKTIYSRKGKTPEQRTLRLYTTLYVNEDMLKAGPSPAGGSDPAGGSLLPLLRVRGESLTARIMFDGETFEIREHPPRSANPVIFRAEIPE
jgi:hypothetical protein